MSLHVHVDRLILEGFPLDPVHAEAVRSAAEAELARRLGEGGVGRDLQRGEPPRPPLGGLQIRFHAVPVLLGRRIGAALYESIGR